MSVLQLFNQLLHRSSSDSRTRHLGDRRGFAWPSGQSHCFDRIQLALTVTELLILAMYSSGPLVISLALSLTLSLSLSACVLS
jgi:hypothetical protein